MKRKPKVYARKRERVEMRSRMAVLERLRYSLSIASQTAIIVHGGAVTKAMKTTHQPFVNSKMEYSYLEVERWIRMKMRNRSRGRNVLCNESARVR